jgi:hypothetical protein
VLLDAMQSYFEYTLYTFCGIPAIALEGTVTDWRSVASRARDLATFDLGWIMAFFPYLKGHDGMATVQNEWLLEPGLCRAHILSPWAERVPDASGGITVGPRSDAFPGGLSRVPFRWEYGFESYPMEFLEGFVGVRQDHATLALRPEIGWAVRPAS